ncbi:hypothetical protein [Burkholderia pseudomallei]|uniref:hypothetical protein n=1 Tax=Burkholderia pseudomallei TaxID=28450 RepID=UPI000A54A2C8|nr:hypothetical protein [Burkholderia pseudomallei]MBF3874210.1 hypothetical protein [Burkholderia pseudomallei]MBF3906474.1 hypothetical protein [Burkholderia pseudomallei]MCW0032024.1 hypothetical protein [Burkholderia pseudomallei]MCW0088654.1 hypothetical protein [Burkholderia pseudomallei]MCW0109268.1 hypothetical protein [Burkholderia pseudomallei]
MKLQAPENCGGFSTPDTRYEVSADGTVDLPPELVPLAHSHGFTDPVAPVKRGKKVED